MSLDPLPVESERLILRRLDLGDIDRFQAYRCDPEVGRYQGWQVLSLDEATAFLIEMSQAVAFVPGLWFQIGIADRPTGDLIGDIGVCVSSDETYAEVGFTLSGKWQGKGLATEAILALISHLFATTNVERIEANTDASNLASIRLLERVGMERVETVDAIFRGEPCEEHLYELRRPLQSD